MNDLPHGLTPEDLKALEELDGNIQIGPDITYDEYIQLVRWILRRRRRGAASTGIASSITVTPAQLAVPQGAPVGTVVGTLGILNGFGTYTFSFISNPGSYFTIVGNQIQVATALPAPTVVPLTVQADNFLGDRPVLNTSVTITTSGYTPTYYLYGF